MSRLGLCLILILAASCGSRSDNGHTVVLINEIVPDGANGDWIELRNPNAHNVDLSGYYLSDNPERPLKWRFPSGPMISDLLVVGIGDDAAVQGDLRAEPGLR